jgi:hypothetical protein
MSSFWNIEYKDGLLDQDSETRRMVRMIKELQGTDVPHALAAVVKAGYGQLVSAPLPSVKGSNTRKSGTDQRRPFDREGA